MTILGPGRQESEESLVDEDCNPTSTGQAQYEGYVEVIEELNLKENTSAMCFDTTSSNTGFTVFPIDMTYSINGIINRHEVLFGDSLRTNLSKECSYVSFKGSLPIFSRCSKRTCQP